MELADKVRRARAGRSYAEIARAVGCTPANIRKIEAEASQPGFVLGVRLAWALNVPADWLADDSADWPPPVSDQARAEGLVRKALTGAGLVGELSEDERDLLAAWRRLSDRRRGELQGLATGWADTADATSITPAEAGQIVDDAARDDEAERRRTRGVG